MNPRVDSIVKTFHRLLHECKASEIISEADKLYKAQNMFHESCNHVNEARDILCIVFRACGELGSIDVAKKYFHKAMKEDSEAPPSKGFSPQFNIPYTVNSKPTGIYEAEHKDFVPLYEQISKRRFPMLNTPVCNMYLHALSSWKLQHLHYDEVRAVRDVFTRSKIAMNACTYHYLMEMHYRTGLDVSPLWWELRSKGITPSSVTLKNPLSTIIVQHPDPSFVVDVVRVMFEIDSVERNVIVNVLEALCRNDACTCEQVTWALFELEQHCAMEKIIVMEMLNSVSIPTRILIKAAKSGDVPTMKLILAFLERHSIMQTPDVYGLSVYTLARSEKVNEALDLVNQMGRQGLLDGQEAQRKFCVEAVNVSMEYHYLYTVAMNLAGSVQMLDDAYFYLEEKHKAEKSVTVHALDLIVLACARIYDEQRAMETVESYTKVFGIQPRVLTFLYLIQACGGKNKSKNQKKTFNIILESGLRPTTAIYKLLIKQALAADNIDEALEFLDILGEEHLHDKKHWNKEEDNTPRNGQVLLEETAKKSPGHCVKLEPDTIKLFIEKALHKQDFDLADEILHRSVQEWNVLLDMKFLQHVEETLFQLGFKMGRIKEAIRLHSKGFLKVPKA